MSIEELESEWDYVIVGAGSAGCVLARRLTEDPDVRVLLLEAGGNAPAWDWRVHMPAAFSYPMNSTTYNWDYRTVPQPNLANRAMHTPRGRVLGGSSAINGMAYVRGHPLDYDRWAQDPELEHWCYRDCLPYFRRAETRDLGADDYHGGDGPLYVTTGRGWSPLYQAFVEAGQQAGYPYTEDMNGYRQEGFGPMQMTVREGVRWSTWKGYLRPILGRDNLDVYTRALSLRVSFDNNRATGIVFSQRGRLRHARAKRRVILAGGPINSPQLLMLSGIGPADHLREHGIDVRADLPGVGSNLQDHLELYVQQRCSQPVSLYPALKPLNKVKIGMQWFLLHTGHGATNHFEAGGFIRSRAGVRHPDLQYHFMPMAVRYDGKSPIADHGFQGHVGPMRSRSRGTVRLASDDPRRHPVIDPQYMSHPEDWEEMRASIRLTREIFEQEALAPYAGGELAPGTDVQSDAELDRFIAEAAESAYHPSCTCGMGSGPDAVVDGSTAVHGVEGLNVVDSSIMPTIVSGNLNAPTIMVAEKAADLIAGRKPLPPSDAPVWTHPDWQSSQR
ncbi:MAG: choline dehydrogenase [Halofilum sp. (in: g-proteobacteria)]|nr:choline dehydrogenase [Halofilum sp. (in: g-proteobacteria)]